MADGKTSPFGNGDGNVGGGGASGAHDFTKDNTSHSPKTGGRDFTKEGGPKTVKEVEANPASIPAGGPLPFKAPGASGNTGDTAPKSPFKGLK